MQRLSDYIRFGHSWYVTGQISIEKAGYFAGKLDSIYRVGQTRLDAFRQRKEGKACFKLIMFYSNNDQENVRWWLLRSPGEAPTDATKEKWTSVLEHRLQLDGYELVRLPRQGKSSSSWTWRYQAMRIQAIRDSVLMAIRSKDDLALQQLIYSSWRTPGFSGAREQVKKLKALIISEWKRTRHSREGMPHIPSRIGYVQRLPDIGLKLSKIRTGERVSRRVSKT